eukprot:COSAG01_NODE_25104_length_755_cov_2.195122_1_plen_37_part_01
MYVVVALVARGASRRRLPGTRRAAADAGPAPFGGSRR